MRYERITETAWKIHFLVETGKRYVVRRRGMTLRQVSRSPVLIRVPSGESVDVEIVEAGSEETVPAADVAAEVRMARVAGARQYRIDEYVSGSWVERATLDDASADELARRMAPLTRGSSNQYRVVPIGADGNEGTAAAVTVEGLRPPDVPLVSWTYDADTGLVTVAAV